ncbi:MAG: hypothetical protein QHC90_25190 [Shinella sp.]|nr:hypothetical protein [Shinella sp.]
MLQEIKPPKWNKVRISRLSRFKIWWSTRRATRNDGYGGEQYATYLSRLGGSFPVGEEDVILAACDDRYFERFALPLIASIAASSGEHALHLHLLKPSEHTVSHAENLRSSFGNVKFTFTVDLCEDAFSGNDIRIYYTAARFILAPAVLAAGVKRLLIIDVDALMQNSPWPIMDSLRPGVTIAFNSRPTEKRAWKKMLAGAVLYVADPVSKRFAGRLSRALLMNVGRPQQYYVDQIIPYYLSRLSERGTRDSIENLPAGLMSLEMDEAAAFWIPKGRDKVSEEFIRAQGHVDDSDDHIQAA